MRRSGLGTRALLYTCSRKCFRPEWCTTKISFPCLLQGNPTPGKLKALHPQGVLWKVETNRDQGGQRKTRPLSLWKPSSSQPAPSRHTVKCTIWLWIFHSLLGLMTLRLKMFSFSCEIDYQREDPGTGVCEGPSGFFFPYKGHKNVMTLMHRATPGGQAPRCKLPRDLLTESSKQHCK